MKTLFTSLSFILIVLVLSCEKNETEELPPKTEVVLSTDKSSYMNLQDIVFKLSNISYSNLAYFGCAYSNTVVLEIEKYTNEEWIIEHFTLCVDYDWHPFPENEEIADTIQSNWFDAGKYRLVTKLMEDTLQLKVYSNEFDVN